MKKLIEIPRNWSTFTGSLLAAPGRHDRHLVLSPRFCTGNRAFDVTTNKRLWESTTWLRLSDEFQTTHCCLETNEMSDSDEETPTDHQLKFVVLGDGASGKVSYLDKLLSMRPLRSVVVQL